ncbi:MAG TPA: serine protease [Phycisphaerae bacterium]|nr:serine protease [Phycisphaerae bacterium]
MKSHSVVLAAVAAALAAAPHAQAQQSAYDTAKQAYEQWKDAVVTVKLVRKVRMVAQGREMDTSEDESEIVGTVVHESGLTAASLFAADPQGAFAERWSRAGFSVDSQITQAKIVLADGKEIPGKVVLRDKDLDLMYVRPDDKSLKLKHVPIEQGARLSVLSPVILLGRLDRSADRAPTVRVERISAVVEKPRLMYVLAMGVDSMNDFGAPVLDEQGNPVGLMLVKLAPAGAGRSVLSSGFLSPVVLPAEQVAKITKQALEAPDPVPTTAEADAEGEAETPEDEDEIATLPPTTQPADEP